MSPLKNPPPGCEQYNLITNDESSVAEIEIVTKKPSLEETEDDSESPSRRSSSESDGEAVVVPPDGGWGWVIVFASFMSNMIVDGIIFSFGIFLADIAQSFQVNKSQVTLVGSLMSGFYLIVGPFASAIANRYGFRLVAIIGSVMGAAALFLSYFATSVQFLCISYGILGGIGFGFIYVPAVIAVGYYFEKWRALATGIGVCGSGIGTFLFAPLSSFLIKHLDWREALLCQGVIVASCIFFGILYRPLKPIKLKDIDKLDEHEKEDLNADIEKLPVATRSKMEEALKFMRTSNGQENNIHSIPRLLGVNNNSEYPTLADVYHTIGVPQPHRRTVGLPSIIFEKRSSVPHLHDNMKLTYESRKPLLKTFTERSMRHRTISEVQRPTFEINRPLYRDDIFFGASLTRLPEYTSRGSLAYNLAVTRVPTKNDVEEEKKHVCKLFPEAVKRTLATMLDYNLLKSPSFLLLAFGGFLTMMGFYVPFMYLADRAKDSGMSEDLTVWLVSSIGIANTVGRVLCGVLSSFPGVNALFVTNTALTIGGFATIISGWSAGVGYQFTYSVVFGLSISPIICGLTNKYGFRIITFIGGIMASAVLLASSFLTKLNLFLFVFGVFGGLACALIYVPSVVIVGFYFERWRALASAISVCGSSCGIICFPLILSNLLEDYQWTGKFRILSVSFLLIPALSLTFKPLKPVTVHPNPEQEDSVLSVYLGGDHGAVLSRMYSNYHNLQYPTTAEVQESSLQTQPLPNIKKDFSSSSTLVATSGYPGGSSIAISKMSTVLEDEFKFSLRDWCLQLWRQLCNCSWCCKFKGIRNTLSTISRPMYRDDIFFAGSVYTLPEYPKKPSVKTTVSSVKGTVSKKSAIDYHLSVTRVATQKDLDEETKTFICCPEALKRIVATMLDFNLLKSPSFLCLSISGFLVSLGMHVPFVYIVQKAMESNIDKNTAAMMVTGLGAANLFGRILSGVMASFPQVNALVITYVGLFVAGIPTLFFAFATDLWMYYIFIALYGSFIATVPSMKTIILVDLLGLDKLTNAFGITLMFQGVSSFMGLPIAGYFIESTNSYNASFLYCGCTTILSGIMLIPIKYIKHWEEKKSMI
ncbi:hypothetical protein HHI36_012264 [Cryptolaemus montrouzieri]|uniref:Major facilitator superfamily (MFS) profile domain-containing protein n=1 Tax=Cryptolaemus montrouzieri TaxID=559131 RepID=A0ABD2NE32_9CUCU